MKFVTLALAVLLAVGCQAASLQADAPASLPGYLEQARGYMRMALNNLKESAHRIADRITDENTKNAIITRADAVHTNVIALQDKLSPMTDSVVQTLDEVTRDMRISIATDMDNLKKDLEPLREDLKATVDKHMQAYKEKLIPVMQEYRLTQEEQMALLKAKFEPQLVELRQMIDINVEETKSKLVPIIEAIRIKIGDRVESVRLMIEPYIHEYREQLKKAATDASNADYQEILAKLRPKMDGLKTSFEELLSEVQSMMGQQQ